MRPIRYVSRDFSLQAAHKVKSPTPRPPRRTLAEFGREVGKTALSLAQIRNKTIAAERPPVVFMTASTAYYDYPALKAWWAKYIEKQNSKGETK